jgi:hypothetical protein
VGWILFADVQSKKIDAYVMERLPDVSEATAKRIPGANWVMAAYPLVLKGVLTKIEEVGNERWNQFVLKEAAKVWPEIANADQKRQSGVAKVTAEANFEANMAQKVVAGSLVDFYLVKNFPGQLIAFCQKHPESELAIRLSEWGVRAVERTTGSLAVGAYVTNKTNRYIQQTTAPPPPQTTTPPAAQAQTQSQPTAQNNHPAN